MPIVKERQVTIYIVASAIVAYIIGYLVGPTATSVYYPTSSTETLSTSNTDASSTTSTSTSTSTSISGLEFIEITFFNEYTYNRPLLGSYPFNNIVEPYKTTTFQVTNAIEGYSYEWSLDGWHQEDGTSINILFLEPAGEYQTILIKMRDETSGKLQISKEVQVICKYVRREIRSLIDQDREAFFQAVAIMQRIPTQTGKKIYGKKYRSKDFFNRMHLYYGGNKSCDHWHQGPGFVTSHVTFSLMYEQSLQSINPSISLPYWDFTIESTLFEPETFRDSGVFSEHWFGDSYCYNDDHTPSSGRFSYVPVMENALNYSSLVSPYGLLRSPWNADPTPYLTRSNYIYNLDNNLKPSGCFEYHHSVGLKTWKDLAQKLNSAAHGHIHELIGGSWNPFYSIDTPTSSSATGLADAYEFAHGTEAYSKLLWRYNYLTCRTKDTNGGLCERGVDSLEDCQCTCPADALYNVTIPHILSETGIIKSLVFYDKDGNSIEDWQNKTTKLAYDTLPGYTYDDTQAIYQDILDILCNPGYIGDMFQATSTNDITFWILHPTLDRLWHLMRLNAFNGIIDFDDSWPDESQTCDGHYSYSTTPFKNIFDSNNVVYTNSDLYSLLDPTTDVFPYIYDNFRWSHCNFLGYNMEGINSDDR